MGSSSSSSSSNPQTFSFLSQPHIVGGSSPVVNISPLHYTGTRSGPSTPAASSAFDWDRSSRGGLSAFSPQIPTAPTPDIVPPSSTGQGNIVTTVVDVDTDHGAVLAGRDIAVQAINANLVATVEALEANAAVNSSSLATARAAAANAHASASAAIDSANQSSAQAAAAAGVASSNSLELSSQIVAADLEGDAMLLEFMGGLVGQVEDSRARDYASSLDFAHMVTRDDDTFSLDTAIRWGAGTAIAIAAFWSMK